jgi:hypothetical protein
VHVEGLVPVADDAAEMCVDRVAGDRRSRAAGTDSSHDDDWLCHGGLSSAADAVDNKETSERSLIHAPPRDSTRVRSPSAAS